MTNDQFMDIIFTAFILAGGSLLLGSFFCNKEKKEQVQIIETRQRELWENNQETKSSVMHDLKKSSSPYNSIETNSSPSHSHTDPSIDLSIPDVPTL